MLVPAFGVLLFLLAFALHWAWWRWRRPQATATSLIVLLVTTIVVTSAVLFIVARTIPGVAPFFPADIGEWCQTVILALAISASYVMTYPAVEVESPTLVMIRLIANGGAEGIETNTLYQSLSDDFLVMARVNDLCNEGLVIQERDRFVLTGRGKRLARVFFAWRKLLGLGWGG